MKKIIISIAVIMVVGCGFLLIVNKLEAKESIYKLAETTTTANIDSDDYVVLFSRPTCSYCNELEPDAISFYKALTANTDVKFYLYNTEEQAQRDQVIKKDKDVENVDFYLDPKMIPEGYNLDEFKILGTPTFIHVKDGVITDIGIGGTYDNPNEPGCVEIFEKMALEYGFTYDAILNNKN